MEQRHHWFMPSSHTFSIPAIRSIVEHNIALVGGIWLDPFAGDIRVAPNVITNDLDPKAPTDFHGEAVDFLRRFEDESADGVVFDPPYSPRQIAECYKSIGLKTNYKTTQSSFWGDVKKQIARVVRPGGRVVTCCWNSNGIGASNNFYKLAVVNVAHGGWHNDTIVTVERKLAFRCSNPKFPDRQHSFPTCNCEE